MAVGSRLFGKLWALQAWSGQLAAVRRMTTSQKKAVRVACGMSGGVDSAVSAMLLKRQGYEVVGVFMKNWDTVDEGESVCAADREAADVERICSILQIPFRHVTFVKEYWQEVFQPLLSDYQNGLTPNPDVECNRYLKFGHFHDHCLKKIGCDYIATGHYARTAIDENGVGRLLQAVDKVKDQTFFLSQIRQGALKTSLFPVGHLTKDRVKILASENGLDWVARKKESMGICFVGKKYSFADFMDKYVEPTSGSFVDIDSGENWGSHSGVHHWTLGQRVRLSGRNDRVYVAEKDVPTQTIKICSGEFHPALMTDMFFTEEPHWISGEVPGRFSENLHHSLECDFRCQNTFSLSRCAVTIRTSGHGTPDHIAIRNGLSVATAEPQRATTIGQYAVFYQGEECLGSARIDEIGPSHHAMNKNNCRYEILEELRRKKSLIRKGRRWRKRKRGDGEESIAPLQPFASSH